MPDSAGERPSACWAHGCAHCCPIVFISITSTGLKDASPRPHADSKKTHKSDIVKQVAICERLSSPTRQLSQEPCHPGQRRGTCSPAGLVRPKH